MKRIFMSGSLFVAILSLNAQTDTSVGKSFHDTLVLSPIEVRATRVDVRSPFATSNIGKQEIANQNLGQELPYFLSQVPSVVVSSDDGLGVGYSSLRIRGTDMARTNVTFNGIPVNDAESQGAFFVDIPDIASGTGSIQIQRGVGASTNGAGAFGASINIYNIEQSEKPSLTLSNAYGSYNTWKHTIQAATGLLRGGFQFDVRLSRINSSGYIQRANTNLRALQFIAGWTSKDEQTSIKFNLLTGTEKTGQAWNGIGTSFTSDEDPATVNYEEQLDNAQPAGRRSNTLGEISPGNYYNDQTDNYQQDYYQLFLNHKFNPYWSSNISLFMTRGKGYYNEYKSDESFEDYGLQNPVIGDSVITTTNLTRQLWLDNYYYGTVFSANYHKNNTSLNIGGAYTRYDAKHYGFIKWADVGVPLDYQWYHLTAYKRDFNIFSKLQQQIISNFYGFIDLQLRTVIYDINGFRKNPTLESGGDYTFFNPKAGLSYFIKHANTAQSKIYGSVAIAHKEPNRDDFEANTADAPRPEQLTDVELGYSFSSKKFDAGINGYYMKYKDQLILTGKINDVGAYVRSNVDNSYRAGVELTAAVKPADWLQASANATFSSNKIKDIVQYNDDYDNGGQLEEHYTNTDISFSPRAVAAASLSIEPFTQPTDKQHFFIDLSEKYVGRQFLDNASNKLRSINPYTLTDTRLRYQFTSDTFKAISLIFMVNNVFNKKYENNGYTYSYLYGGVTTTENYYFPQAGTNWNIGVSFSL
ncbi:MAG: TonB-dependent receptor [Niabella sp.]